MSDTTLLQVRSLGARSVIDGKTRTILAGVDFDLRRGETIGIVGESGSGKSIASKAIIGLLPTGVEATGEVVYEGSNILGARESELLKVRGSEISLLLQDPFTMLNPLHRCGAHIEEGLHRAGRRLSRAERRDEAVRRLAEVGIHDPRVAQQYPFELSGGMRQRVALAAALARDPKVLIADEPTTALDVTTQMEIIDLLTSVQAARGMGLILITHDLRLAFSACDRLYVLYAGTVLETGGASEVEDEPLHPYSLGLLLSEPTVEHRRTALAAIPGSVPSHDDVASQCAFSDRCDWSTADCVAQKPGLAPLSTTRASACVRIGEIRPLLTERRLLQARSVPAAIAAAPARTSPLLEVERLRKVFPTGVEALKGVSIAVERGESVGIVGESGSGKTTLARCLLGLERPTSGTIKIAGIDAGDFSQLSGADRRTLRSAIQIVFQDPYSSLNPARTIGATLAEACALRGPGGSSVVDLLARVGLPAGYAQRKPAALSGGERQRVAVARAIAVKPQILVCDEPVSALDVSVQAQILNLLAKLREELGLTYLFITHDLAVVRQVVDRVYVCYRGEVVEEGDVETILDRPQHPYTRRLLEAQTRLSERPERAAADLSEIAIPNDRT